MKTETYMKEFESYDFAFDFMAMKNKAFEKAGNKKDILCLVPGHSDNYAVVDLTTAIELGLGYVWASRGWVSNPFKN